MVSGDGETYNMPAEVMEQLYPLRVKSWRFNTEPGGQGAFRGGNGLVKELEVLTETATLSATFGRFRFPPWGLAGGRDGRPNRVVVHRRGEAPRTFGKVAGLDLRPGDVVEFITGIGGGYGDPRERERWRVEEDLASGFITQEEAQEVYHLTRPGSGGARLK
jgi:N-methylhydantoinase B